MGKLLTEFYRIFQLSCDLMTDSLASVQAHYSSLDGKFAIHDACQGKNRNAASTLQHGKVASLRQQAVACFDMVGSSFDFILKGYIEATVDLNGYTSLPYCRCKLVQGKFMSDQVVVFHAVRPSVSQEKCVAKTIFHFCYTGL